MEFQSTPSVKRATYDNPELMGGWEEIYESSHT